MIHPNTPINPSSRRESDQEIPIGILVTTVQCSEGEEEKREEKIAFMALHMEAFNAIQLLSLSLSLHSSLLLLQEE